MTASTTGLGGLAGDIETSWSTLTAIAEKGLKGTAKAGLQGAVERIKVSEDTLSIAPWSGTSWTVLPEELPDWDDTICDEEPGRISVAAGIPLVRLDVRTKYSRDYIELESALLNLPVRATKALDLLAIVGASPPGDAEPGEQRVRPVVTRKANDDLAEARLAITGEPATLLHRRENLTDAQKKVVADALGEAQTVHCPALSAGAPFALIVADRIQFHVSQEWTLRYLPADNGETAALELSIVGAFRSRDGAAVAFKKIS